MFFQGVKILVYACFFSLLTGCAPSEKLGLSKQEIDSIKLEMDNYVRLSKKAYSDTPVEYDFNVHNNKYIQISGDSGRIDSFRRFGGLMIEQTDTLKRVIKRLNDLGVSGYSFYDNIGLPFFVYKRSFSLDEYYETRFLCKECDSIVRSSSFESFFVLIDSFNGLYYFRHK